jgi:putative DNA primase/helicase
VRGALAWQKGGLAAPDEVRKAVATYQEAQGDLEEFLDECCVLGSDLVATHAELWAEYSRWTQADRRNSRDSSKGLGKRLRKRFGEPVKRRTHKSDSLVYRGVGIRTSSEPEGLF